MRVVWKRNLIGNLLVLFLFLSLLVGYVVLLRYNKASASHFNLVPRHRKIRGVAVLTVESKQLNKLGVGGKHVDKNQKPHSSGVDIFVVEEHHQVIPVWLKAVKSGTVAVQGNTLVHIDGHGDTGIPRFISGYPFFRLPRDSHEENRMIQRNDVFIMQAGMAGLLKRVVWIWPKWDQPNHETPYEVVKVELGWANIKTVDLKEKVFCACFTNSSNVRECEYAPNMHSGLENKETHIPYRMCNIKRKMTLEIVREDVAVKKLRKEKWLLENEKIMLDIDEDYFGCTYASQPLLDAGIQFSMLEQINSILPQLFCPKSVFEERETDKFLVKQLGVFLTPLSCNNTNAKHSKRISKTTPKCSRWKQKNQILQRLKNYLWNERRSVSCGKRSLAAENLVMQLVELFFSHLNPQQIRILQKIGFCLSTTLNSYLPVSQPEFMTCIGLNSPKDSSILVHKPTNNDIFKRTKLLDEIILQLRGYRQPQIVTVCRSVRDGYTPRRYFRQIEHSTLKVLNNSYRYSKVHYDPWLLGGKQGWTVRHIK